MPGRSATLLLVALCVVGLRPSAGVRAQQPAAGAQAATILDIAWLDASGRPVAEPSPGALEVRVDNRPRRVMSVRPVAGARLVLLTVDESTFPPALEKNVRAIASQVAAALGADARVALLTLPVASPKIAFTADRAALGSSIQSLAGKGTAQLVVADAQEAGAKPPVDRLSDDREGRERQDRPETPPRDGGTADVASLAPLQRVLSNLRNTPGPKNVILLSAAGAPKSGAEMGEAVRKLQNAAIASRSTIDIVQLPTLDGSPRAPWFDELASATGGMVLDARRNPESAARALADRLAASFLVELEPDPADRDGRAHPVAVTATPKGRILAAAALPGSDAAARAPQAVPPTPAQAAATPPAATPPANAAAPTSPAAPPRAPRPRDAETDAVLERAAQYLAEYRQALTFVVAEEDYLQRYNRALSIVAPGTAWVKEGGGVDYSILERRLKSDFLIVRNADGSGWLPFRDVFEVDGKAVRDREDRLRKLFLETPGTAVEQARRIMSESARYNLGEVPRTINTPTLPLMLVDPRHRDRFNWKREGDQAIEGVKTRRLDFEEQEHPTLIRTSRGDDVAIAGTLWIDPATGRLVKGTIIAGVVRIDPATGRVLRESVSRQTSRGGVVEVTVVFRPNESLGLWVPAEMKEFYEYPGQTIDATAKYSNFRRFQVKTEETIKIPK